MSKPLSIPIVLILTLTACTGSAGSIDGQPTAPGGASVTFPPVTFPSVTLPPPGGQPLPTYPPPDVGQPEPLPPPDIGQPLPTFPPDGGMPIDGSGRPPVRFTPRRSRTRPPATCRP